MGKVYIIGSQSDRIAPVRTNAANYHRLIAGSGYYEFPGKSGHYVMLGEANDALKKDWPGVLPTILPSTDTPCT